MKKNPLPPPTGNLKVALLGIWRLESRQDVDAAGEIHPDPFLGRDPLGILCFGAAHFSAQFMKRERSNQENAPGRLPAQNNTAGVNGYDAYFGTYSVDEIAGTLTTQLEGSIAPGNIGATYVRDARVAGDELIIQLQTTSVDGIPVTRTNTFVRLA